MDGGIEQNPAYRTARTFIYQDYERSRGVLTLTHTLTDSPHATIGELESLRKCRQRECSCAAFGTFRSSLARRGSTRLVCSCSSGRACRRYALRRSRSWGARGRRSHSAAEPRVHPADGLVILSKPADSGKEKTWLRNSYPRSCGKR